MAADSPRSSGISAKPQTAADFFATDGHYRYLAGRISSTLSEGRFVLVTGDPSASPEMLCRALTSAAAAHHAAISIMCPPELERAEPLGATSSLTEGSLSGGGTGARESSINSTLFVLAELDGLPDAQIKHICEAALLGAGRSAMGVILAGSGFLARLDGPRLSFLKERLAAHFRLQEVGDDERIAFLHHQLARQRQRRTGTRGFPISMLLGLAALGVMLTASIGAFLSVHRTDDKGTEVRSSDLKKTSSTEETSAPPSATSGETRVGPAQAALPAETAATSPSASPPLTVTGPPMEAPGETAPATVPAPAQPPSGRHLSSAEITALIARGDRFLREGDIVSARLFYERAADAGDGGAALRLGTTFDPAFLGRAGVRGIRGDPDQARSWYRRARELGEVGDEQRLRNLETWPRITPDARVR